MADPVDGARPGPKTCVVVSYWVGRPPTYLYKLLNQMFVVEAGSAFDLTIVCNGGDKQPLTLPAKYAPLKPRVFHRENTGYNIGAWEHGWRQSPGYDYYLFLQDDCYIRTPSWVQEFEFRVENDPGIGLLGEMVSYDRMTWDFVRKMYFTYFWCEPSKWPDPIHPVDYFRNRLESRGIAWSEVASHVPSVVLFSPRKVLEEIGGFPYFGTAYFDGVSSEISISRLVEQHGYRFSKVTEFPFEIIGHSQWDSSGQFRTPGLRGFLKGLLWKSKGAIKSTLGLKRKARPRGWVEANETVGAR